MAERQIALLRGINVGKARRIAMAELRALLSREGYQDVRTLLNTGNIVFTPPRGSRGDHAGRIATIIAAGLGISVPVTVLGAAELAEALAVNPLAAVADNPSRLLVAVLNDPASRKVLMPLTRQAWAPEALALGRRVAYVWCSNGISASALFVAVDRLLKDGITSRNWTTMERLLALATGDDA